MAFGSNNGYFLGFKIGISMILTSLALRIEHIFKFVFQVFHVVFKTELWDAKEATFRLRLDSLIVYIGMIVGWISIHLSKKYGGLNSLRIPFWKRLGMVILALSMLLIFLFIGNESKYAYNEIHPYISIAPVLGFIMLRNLYSRYSSRLYKWIGRMSLETFLLQVNNSLENLHPIVSYLVSLGY